MWQGFLHQQTQLSPEDELQFRLWWRQNAPYLGQGGDPDPQHFYDYRGAWRAGEAPYTGPGRDPERPHWGSDWKNPLSPERYLLGKSGRIYDSMKEYPAEEYGYLIDEME